MVIIPLNYVVAAPTGAQLALVLVTAIPTTTPLVSQNARSAQTYHVSPAPRNVQLARETYVNLTLLHVQPATFNLCAMTAPISAQLVTRDIVKATRH